jgi:hypothetical protein
MRTATQDVEIRGCKIAAGDRRLLPYPSENFDEEASASRIGSRSGLRAFFAALLPRIEHIALDGDPSFIQTTVVGGLKTLPLRYAPTRCAA